MKKRIREYIEAILIESLDKTPVKFKDITPGMSIIVWLSDKNSQYFSNEQSHAVGSFKQRYLATVVKTDLKDSFSLYLVTPGIQWGYLEYYKHNADDVFDRTL